MSSSEQKSYNLSDKRVSVSTTNRYQCTELTYFPFFEWSKEKPTIITVPGIANCSETKYVRTFADYAIRQGFKVAVLNHLGAKEEGGLSTPRIFTYGNF